MSGAEKLLGEWRQQLVWNEKAVEYAKEQIAFYAGQVAVEIANEIAGPNEV